MVARKFKMTLFKRLNLQTIVRILMLVFQKTKIIPISFSIKVKTRGISIDKKYK